MYRYKAFGFIIDSDFEIPQALEAADNRSADITIRREDIRSSIPRNDIKYLLYTKAESHFYIKDLAYFRISNGNLIEIDPIGDDYPANELAVYIMGAAFGALIHQRGLLPLHGSCVTNGEQSIIFTGDSGAGKSTTAAEFLKHGWKILTDDVCIIKDIAGTPLAQSSYPSQKLWQDSLEAYDSDDRISSKIYREGGRDKYGVDVRSTFVDGTAPLSLIVRLAPHEEASTSIQPLELFPGAEQLRRNTYDPYMIDKTDYQKHFQNCITLSTKVPMVLVIRHIGENCAPKIYEMICDYLKG